MAKYRIAELLIEIEAKHGLVGELCEKYRVDTCDAPDFSVSVTEDEIAAAMAELATPSAAYAENYCVFRRFCDEAAARGVILFHSAAVTVGGGCYAFSAPSGTGKSTHIALWRRHFGKTVDIINGDKPFLREREGVFTVYGSPWSGKEGWNKNVSAPLLGLCFLFQAKENSISWMSKEEALPRVFAQMLKPPTAEGLQNVLHFADRLISTVPIYRMGCDISKEAALLSFRTMTGKSFEEFES